MLFPTDQSQNCIMNYIHLTKEEKYQIYILDQFMSAPSVKFFGK